MRVLFWGSSDFSMPFLEMLASGAPAGAVVAGVVTNPDKPYGRGMHEVHKTPVRLFAEARGLPCLQPVSLKDASFQEALRALEPDLSVVVSYGRIIPESLLSVPRLQSVNVHASLLPRYRGASPMQSALASGDRETGNTIQFMSREMDKGDIIVSSLVAISDDDDFLSLSRKLSADGVELLKKALPLIAGGSAPRRKQDDSLATYTRLITKEDGLIDFESETAQAVFNKYRAYKAWPGIHCAYHNALNRACRIGSGCGVILTDIEAAEGDGEPGTVREASRSGLVVNCAKGGIRIRRIKPAGKKEMDYLGFINGYKPVVHNLF